MYRRYDGPQKGSTEYVPQMQCWIITLPRLYSVVSHVFPLAASFSNTVNTTQENGKGRKLVCF